MHIPSERIRKEMNAETESIWYVPAIGDENVAILIKAPTSSIKAVISGCRVLLVFGKNNIEGKEYLCTGIRIFDTPDAPIFISGIQREAEEHSALLDIILLRQAPIFLFNEMDIYLAWSYANISEVDSIAILSFVGDPAHLYIGSFSKEASQCLDCFCTTIDNTQKYPGTYPIETIEVAPAFSGWKATNNSFIGYHELYSFSITEQDEGDAFEKAIWFSLESAFPLTLHKRPRVRIGTKERELIDVFSFYHYGIFLVEAKDLSVFDAGYDRTQERKVKRIQRQITKAITQLVGAAKALSRNDPVFSSGGEELHFDRQMPPHCIVLITELLHFGDWSKIEKQLMEAMRDTGAFFNVLDLRELIFILKASSGTAELIDFNLMKRCELFMKTGNVHIRSQPQSASKL